MSFSVKLGFTAWLARGFLRLLACIYLLIIPNTYTALLALANVVVSGGERLLVR